MPPGTPRIHPTAIVEEGVTIGPGTSVWDSVHIRHSTRIGEQCIVGEKTYIAYGVTIGDRVKINAMVYICTAVTIEDGVMISAGTVFTNDRFPRATTPDLKTLRSSDPDETTRPTLVREGATIGAGSTVGCDLTIGRFAMVGMGSLVTHSVPDFHLVLGSPARSVGCVCRCGQVLARFGAEPIPGTLSCAACGLRYGIEGERVTELSAALMHWGIVGGGLLGMTLAHRLRRRGDAVTLLEAGQGLGGLASAWTLGDVVWDRHYHVILLSDSRLRALLEEIGLGEELRFTETRTGFYSSGRLHSMSSALEFLTFPPLGPIEKVRLGATIFYASRIRNWKPLERELVGDWLRRWSGKGTFEKIWLPLLRAKLGSCYERTSAAFIWATIARMYAARRTGLKKEMFGYVRGGYARILDRFTEFLREEGVGIELDAPAQRVERGEGGGIEVTYGGGRKATFDRVVLTMAAPVAARICPGLSAGELEALRRIEYVGIVCASLLLKRPLSPFYITNITDSGIPFTAVIEMTALVDRAELGGRTLVYLPKYALPGDAIFSRSDKEIEEEFLAALRRMHPDLLPEDVLAFRVSRVPAVFSLPTLGYSDALPPTATSIPGLHIVNSAHIVNGTLNVNETIQLAESKLETLR